MAGRRPTGPAGGPPRGPAPGARRRVAWRRIRGCVASWRAKLERQWSPQQIAGWLQAHLSERSGLCMCPTKRFTAALFIQSAGSAEARVGRGICAGSAIRGRGARGARGAHPGPHRGHDVDSPSGRPRPPTARSPATGKAICWAERAAPHRSPRWSSGSHASCCWWRSPAADTRYGGDGALAPTRAAACRPRCGTR